MKRKKRRNNKRIVLVAVLGAIVLFFVLRQAARPDYSLTAEHIGSLQKPSTIQSRDGGGTVQVGNQILWLFGDTFYSPNVPKNTSVADVWRTATNSYTSTSEPFGRPIQPTDRRGNPTQVIPFTPDELAYNRRYNDPKNHYTIWPTGQINLDMNTALIFFQRFLTGTDNSSSTGVAILRAGSGVAQRLPGALFTESEPSFRKAMTKDEYVYLYATEDCSKDKCPVARAPITKATQRSSYDFWDGKTWNKDVTRATPVMYASNYGFTVMWNSFLNKYVSIMIGNLSHQAYVSYADEPQGPWSKPAKAFTLPGKTTYVPYFHPELGSGQDVYMTYSLDNGTIDIMKLKFGF